MPLSVQVGQPAEVATIDGWTPATIVEVNEHYIVFACRDGTRPAYGASDEGLAWRRGRSVACPTCAGTGWVPASEKS
jgi:hypothetical protein